MNLCKACCVLMLVVINFAVVKNGHTEQEVNFYVKDPVAKTLTTKTLISQFIEQSYVHPSVIQLIENTSLGNYSNPEEALIQYLSANMSGDGNWQLNNLTQADRYVRGSDLSQFQTEIASNKQQANALFVNNTIKLDKKITIDEQSIIIQFSVVGPDNTVIITWPVALLLEHNQWKVCLNCYQDATSKYYPLLYNLNYNFDGLEHNILSSKVKTTKPMPPFIKLLVNP